MARTRRGQTGQCDRTAAHAQPGRTTEAGVGQRLRWVQAHRLLVRVGPLLFLAGVCSCVGSTAGTDRTSPPPVSLPRSTPPSVHLPSTPSPTAPTPTSPVSPSPARPTPPHRPPRQRLTPGTALAVLARLPVKGRAPKTGYSREQFGQAWSDDVNVPDGHNGCDTRNDILQRDLIHIRLKPNTDGCVVARGKLADPYTATLITFVRGADTSSLVQIDHVVALSDAWQKGAQKLTRSRRIDFANDPLNLLAVDGAANQQKGDGDAATWLPPNKSYRCLYVARQIAVKRKYHLWVTAAEKAAMQRVLLRCPRQRIPIEGRPPPKVHPTATRAPPRPAAPPPGGGSGVYYPNCDAVRAAGKAPLYRGQPGYRAGLDRDGDGIACE